MHWINDIALAQNNTAVVSGSSDLSVKVWRPYSEESNIAHTIGEHADYVKCVVASATDAASNTVVAAGLDRKICWWDLNGKGKSLEIDVKGEEIPEKGSVYSLALGRSIVASGGPEKTIRLHDPRSGSEVSKLMGHLGNIRSILIDDADDTILSASADKTIKLWSVRGGRCMYTFTMHDESVWSLFSRDPRLGIFYSSDRNGMVAKTDVRGSFDDVDNGISLALAQEHIGVSKVVAAHGHIWTATNRSSINRWSDFDLEQELNLPQAYRHRRSVSALSGKSRQTVPPNTDSTKKEINPASILKLSSMGMFLPRSTTDGESINPDGSSRRASLIPAAEPEPEIQPIFAAPEDTIEGQFGLLKHRLLNDRKRVLTLDTAGDVLLWDLIQCRPVQSFGKQHLEDVADVLNTREAVAPWCSIDLSSGNLTVILEPYNCFDAEIYADELDLEEKIEFREDQRISLGRWVLRYLFANLIDEEIKRDETYRQKINQEVEKKLAVLAANAPHIALEPTVESADNAPTPRGDGLQPAQTPGIGIVGSPGIAVESSNASQVGRQSADRGDYFTAGIAPVQVETVKTPVPEATPAAAATATAAEPKTSTDNAEKLKEKEKLADGGKSPSTPFGKKFRMSFSSKKLGRSGSQATTEKPVVVDEKAVESESSSSHEKEVDDSFYGVIQKIRHEYDKQLSDAPDKLVETRVTPSLAADTPVLKLPPGTKVIIQEETSGGSSNVYQGTVESVGRDADIIEQKAPMWLGDLLLTNQIPFKEPNKISFVLHPLDGLPVVASDGSSRLNANRMLRVKKILGYIAERIEPAPGPDDPEMNPEEYLELYCNEQLLEPTLSLATLRTHIWKGGNDIVLYYKTNGRKELRPLPAPEPEPEPQPAEETPVNPPPGTAV